MSYQLSLDGTWDLYYAEGDPLVNPGQFVGAEVKGFKPIPARVPASVHEVLIENDWEPDPHLACNSQRFRWVEEAYWIYRRTIMVPEDAIHARAWLVFDRLEFLAAVILNGELLGEHENAYVPARYEVTGKLQPGENLLVLRVSTGIHEVAHNPGKYFDRATLSLTKSYWQRKPIFQGSWDWSPRLTQVGILGASRLEWAPSARLDQVTAYAIPSEDLTQATVRVRATLDAPDAGASCTIRAHILETGQEVTAPLQCSPGLSSHDLELTLENPSLWWPVGHGEQSLYTVQVSVECGDRVQDITRRVGVRKVRMNQDPHPEEGRYCILEINDRPIFCKGGNWVPPDMIYGRVDTEDYRRLLDLALEANFNLLRVWGGAVYLDSEMLAMCDEAGVLVWHDFMFACSQYPGEYPAFIREVRREAEWNVRERAHHPSLVVWCGNNEILWGNQEWGYDQTCPGRTHTAIFLEDLPRIVYEIGLPTVYWPGSPSSPDPVSPNSPIMGDQHPWGVSIFDPGPADHWRYRQYVDRFPNEGGVLGSSSPATLRQFLPEDEQHLFSRSWVHHDNPMACQELAEPGALGTAYSTVELWTGQDPQEMSLDEYAFASGLLQAEGLSEYVLNYRRRMFSSAAAVFWMYNDAWPVTNGWTIVDYYHRRKLAYHPVRRAFDPVTVACVDEGEEIVVYGVNDTPDDWQGQIRFGFFSLAGDTHEDCTKEAHLPTNSSNVLGRLPRATWDALGTRTSGAYARLEKSGHVHAQHRLFVERFHDLAFSAPKIAMEQESGWLTLTSDVFVWGVCLDLDGESSVSDNCFDLLPGMPYRIPWQEAWGAPQIAGIGSRDVVSIQ